jgi:class 3 adenylate cyclase
VTEGARRSELRKLLRRYNERPAARDQVLTDIDAGFKRTASILVIDTCGFSRTVKQRGIVYFLALLERLERVVRPSVLGAGGRVLRRDADDVLAIFPDPTAALAASRRILHAVQAANEALPSEDEVGVSIGIGYGELLLVGRDDAWGDEMNLASKLGEDLAEENEVLLTRAAYEALGETDAEFERKRYETSGIEIVAYRLVSD